MNNLEFETLHSNKHRIHFLTLFVYAVVLLVVFLVGRSHARYRVTESIPLVNGTINYSLADLNIVAITVDGEASDTIPEGNYELTENSYCTVNGEEDSSISISYEADTQLLTVTPFTTKGTKCYLDFVTATTKKVDTVLGTIDVNLDTPNFANTSCTSGCDETTVGIYETTDNLGTSYYYRGDVENNYVQFAGYYWRIIRINGDGSVRIIYDGTSAHANGDSSTDRQIGTSAYNNINDIYTTSVGVGYMYQTNAQRPSTQNEGTASTIKGVLDNWYQTNITSRGLDNKVVNSPGFCNDRTMREEWENYPDYDIYYAPYIRIMRMISPLTLKCSNTNDLYTTKVGLITADEAGMAGGVWGAPNDSYYLYIGQSYWTISPCNYYVATFGRNATVFGIYENGMLEHMDVVLGTFTVRPVINLSSDVTLTGTGTMSDPYVVS